MTSNFKEGLFPTKDPDLLMFNYRLNGIEASIILSFKDIEDILKRHIIDEHVQYLHNISR